MGSCCACDHVFVPSVCLRWWGCVYSVGLVAGHGCQCVNLLVAGQVAAVHHHPQCMVPNHLWTLLQTMDQRGNDSQPGLLLAQEQCVSTTGGMLTMLQSLPWCPRFGCHLSLKSYLFFLTVLYSNVLWGLLVRSSFAHRMISVMSDQQLLILSMRKSPDCRCNSPNISHGSRQRCLLSSCVDIGAMLERQGAGSGNPEEANGGCSEGSRVASYRREEEEHCSASGQWGEVGRDPETAAGEITRYGGSTMAITMTFRLANVVASGMR